MIRLLKRLISSQRGQALPIVLALLVLGGLTIAPSLNYMATTLNHGRIIDKGINGIYAADAGVENALWFLTDNVTPPTQLAENINQMEVAIQTEDKGAYTVYFGELVRAGSGSQDLSTSGEIEPDGEAYKFTITVAREGGSTVIHMTEVGARLPVNYSYQPDSAEGFANNLSRAEPDKVQDASGAWMLNWEFETPYPEVSVSEPVKTQTFYITGEGSQGDHYTWVVANRADIGEVGEITGELYIIRSTATQLQDGGITAEIVADVLIDGEVARIISWQVSN